MCVRTAGWEKCNCVNVNMIISIINWLAVIKFRMFALDVMTVYCLSLVSFYLQRKICM